MAVACIAFKPAAIENSRQQGTHTWCQLLLIPQRPCSDQHALINSHRTHNDQTDTNSAFSLPDTIAASLSSACTGPHLLGVYGHVARGCVPSACCPCSPNFTYQALKLAVLNVALHQPAALHTNMWQN